MATIDPSDELSRSLALLEQARAIVAEKPAPGLANAPIVEGYWSGSATYSIRRPFDAVPQVYPAHVIGSSADRPWIVTTWRQGSAIFVQYTYTVDKDELDRSALDAGPFGFRALNQDAQSLALFAGRFDSTLADAFDRNLPGSSLVSRLVRVVRALIRRESRVEHYFREARALDSAAMRLVRDYTLRSLIEAGATHYGPSEFSRTLPESMPSSARSISEQEVHVGRVEHIDQAGETFTALIFGDGDRLPDRRAIFKVKYLSRSDQKALAVGVQVTWEIRHFETDNLPETLSTLRIDSTDVITEEDVERARTEARVLFPD